MSSWKKFAAGHRKGGTAVSMVFVQPIPSLAAIEPGRLTYDFTKHLVECRGLRVKTQAQLQHHSPPAIALLMSPPSAKQTLDEPHMWQGQANRPHQHYG